MDLGSGFCKKCRFCATETGNQHPKVISLSQQADLPQNQGSQAAPYQSK